MFLARWTGGGRPVILVVMIGGVFAVEVIRDLTAMKFRFIVLDTKVI